MKKKSLFICLSLLIIVAQAYSEETYTVSGTIRTSYDGDIYIGVYTMEDWQNSRDKFPSQPYFQIIKITEDLSKADKIPFKFENIKKGEYSIIAYQDKNKNGKLDRLIGGQIAEPQGRYKEPIMWPSWKEMSFKLDHDITNVDIAITDSLYQENK